MNKKNHLNKIVAVLLSSALFAGSFGALPAMSEETNVSAKIETEMSEAIATETAVETQAETVTTDSVAQTQSETVTTDSVAQTQAETVTTDSVAQAQAETITTEADAEAEDTSADIASEDIAQETTSTEAQATYESTAQETASEGITEEATFTEAESVSETATEGTTSAEAQSAAEEVTEEPETSELDDTLETSFELDSFSSVGITISRGDTYAPTNDSDASYRLSEAAVEATEDFVCALIENNGGTVINGIWRKSYFNSYYAAGYWWLLIMYSYGGTNYISVFLPTETDSGVTVTQYGVVISYNTGTTYYGEYTSNGNGLSTRGTKTFYLIANPNLVYDLQPSGLAIGTGAEYFSLTIGGSITQEFRFAPSGSGNNLGTIYKYTVKYYLQDAGESSYEEITDSTQYVFSGTSESSLTNPTVEAVKTINSVTYTFDGWYEDEACTIPASFSGTITSDKNYYAKYKAQEVTVTYKVKEPGATDYSEVSNETVEINTAYTDLNWPSVSSIQAIDEETGLNTLYTIGSWKDEDGDTVDTASSTDTVTEDIIFYADYEAVANPVVTMTKEVTGNYASKTKEFAFSYSNTTASGDDENKKTDSFTLKHGGSKEITVHYDGTLNLSELLEENSGYAVKINGEETDSVTLTNITEDTIITVINTREVIVPTGLGDSSSAQGRKALMALVSLLGVAFVLSDGKKGRLTDE